MSTEEIQHAFQQTRPQARRKRAASSFAIAEDSEEGATHIGPVAQANVRSDAPASTSFKIATSFNSTPGTVSFEGVSTTQPWKSLRSRNIASSTNSSAPLDSKSHNSKQRLNSKSTTKLSSTTTCHPPATTTYASSRKCSERIPLGAGQDETGEPNMVVDRAGSFTGKENIPPNAQTSNKRNKIDKTPTAQKTRNSNSVSPYTPFSVVRDREGNYVGSQGLLLISKPTTDLPKTSKSKNSFRIPPGIVVFTPTIIRRMREEAEQEAEDEIFDDYEDHKVVLVDIINLLFDTCKITSTSCQQDLKPLLQRIYDATYCSTVLRKVESSISHGALQLHPFEAKNGDYMQQLDIIEYNADIRRQFIDLWTESYEPLVLRAALEIVVGKKIRVWQNDLPTSIQRFLESYLVFHKDEKGPRPGYQNTWEWGRTMHRSLALILLMDQAKLDNVIPDSLFRATSARKSSLSVLQDVSTLLRRSHSEAVRILKVLGYSVAFSQDTWSEYDFHCKNVKWDFKDGMRMARLLELVTAPSEHDSPPRSAPMLKVSDLKYSAKTYSDKRFNVEKVLRAFDPGMDDDRRRIIASDLVDGDSWYTICLLWTIISEHGAKHMIDLSEICFEVKRLGREAGIGVTIEKWLTLTLSSSSSSYLDKCFVVLSRWLILLGRKHNIQIVKIGDTFTADPSPFAAIVKEYLPYITNGRDQPQSKSQSLKKQLQQLGCGSKFSVLLTKSRKFDEQLLFPVLAFLAFKVLGASKERRREKAALNTSISENNHQDGNARERIKSAKLDTEDFWWDYLYQQTDYDWFSQVSEVGSNEKDEEDICRH